MACGEIGGSINQRNIDSMRKDIAEQLMCHAGNVQIIRVILI